MRPAAGSTLWLLEHELRLAWRRSRLSRRSRFGLTAAVLLLVVVQALGLLIAAGFANLAGPPGAEAIAIGGIVLLFSFGLMLSQAVHRAIEALYGRGDLAWLLSTPVPPRRVMAVRMLACVVETGWIWLLPVAAVVNGLALLGRPHFLVIYAVPLALALVATVASFAIALALLSWLGPRPARIVAGALATLFGLAVLLGSQTHSQLGWDRYRAVIAAIMPSAADAATGAAWLPARALLGDPGSAAVCLALAFVVYMGSAWGLGRHFASGALVAQAAVERRRAGHRPRSRPAFRGGLLRVMLRKELRLLVRAPRLANQLLRQCASMLPLAILLWRGQWAADESAALLVLAAGGLSQFFAKLAMEEDQAADLAASAPVPPGMVHRARLLAVVLVIACVVAVPLAAIVTWRPYVALPLLACLAGAVLSAALLGLRRKPGKRTDLAAGRRGVQLLDIAGLLLAGAWALATWLAIRLWS